MGFEHLSRDDDDPWPTGQTVAEGGGTLEMAGDLTRKELGAHLAAADAHTDTKFERLLGEMRAGFAHFEARMDVRFAAMEAKMDVRFAEFSGSVNTRFAETNARIDAKPSVTQLWAVMGTAAGLGLAMVGVIFTSVQWLDAREAERNALRSPPAVHAPAQP